jgi:hypothetical protein
MRRPPEHSAAAQAGAGPAAAERRAAPAPGWSRARQDLAVVLWMSFLTASAATMFFFAVFDPVVIGEGTPLAGLLATANAGYALGFFFFWLIAAVSGALSMYLARTQRGDRATPAAPASRDTP